MAAALLVQGCSVPPDIVARVQDNSQVPTGVSPPQQLDAALDAGRSGRCGSSGDDLWLWKASGELARLSADTLTLSTLGTPSCLEGGVVTAAIDQSGQIWAQAAEGGSFRITPDSLACEPLDGMSRATAFAIVHDTRQGAERLFALELGRLLEIDLVTCLSTAIGTSPARTLLAGPADELLAPGESTAGQLDLALVDLDDASEQTFRSVKIPSTLLAGAYFRGELTLLLGSRLYHYPQGEPEAESLLALPSNAGYAGVFASTCAAEMR